MLRISDKSLTEYNFNVWCDSCLTYKIQVITEHSASYAFHMVIDELAKDRISFDTIELV